MQLLFGNKKRDSQPVPDNQYFAHGHVKCKSEIFGARVSGLCFDKWDMLFILYCSKFNLQSEQLGLLFIVLKDNIQLNPLVMDTLLMNARLLWTIFQSADN